MKNKEQKNIIARYIEQFTDIFKKNIFVGKSDYL